MNSLGLYKIVNIAGQAFVILTESIVFVVHIVDIQWQLIQGQTPGQERDLSKHNFNHTCKEFPCIVQDKTAKTPGQEFVNVCISCL